MALKPIEPFLNRKNSKFGLFLVGVLTLFVGYGIVFTKFDYNFERFFPENDKEARFFKQYRSNFDSGNDFLLVAIEREKGLFDRVFLEKVQQLTHALESGVANLEAVVSVTNQEHVLLFSNGSVSKRKIIRFSENSLVEDSILLFQSKDFVGSLVAENGKSLCIFLRHKDKLSQPESDQLLADVQKEVANYTFEKVHIAGRTIGQKFYIDLMANEMSFFLGLSGILIVFFLFFTFRSIWGVVLPLIVIALSLIWVVGSMGWFNQPINILLITLPTILFVVAMSDVIHIVSLYLDALRKGITKTKAIVMTIREVGGATLLTSITTSIGFFSLYFVNVQPIKVFGVITGIGVLIAFALSITVLPMLFILFPNPKLKKEVVPTSFWSTKLRQWFIPLLRNRTKVLVAYGAFVIVCCFGIVAIQSNNFLMDDLSQNEPLKKDFNFLDDNFGGARPFDLAIKVKGNKYTVWDPLVLEEVEKVETYLTKVYGVSIKFSLVKALKSLNRSANLGKQEQYKLPTNKKEIARFRRMLKIADGGKLFRSLVDSTEQHMRINGTIGDIGNKEVTKKNRALNQFLTKLNHQDILSFQLTGTAHLLDKNMAYLAQSLILGLSFSILLVALVMGMVYQSFSMLLISLIPNLIPLLAIGALMGFMGIELKTSTSIIFTIAFGIAVDDTIHLLGRFKLELSKGRSKIVAMKNAYQTTGKAMVITTFILCSGFFLLVFSDYMGAFYMGLLISVTLFVALIADLTLLPILIVLFYHPKKPN